MFSVLKPSVASNQFFFGGGEEGKQWRGHREARRHEALEHWSIEGHGSGRVEVGTV